MRVFLDTNVLIVFIARREPFILPASNVMDLGIRGKIKIFVSPLSYATCVFVARKVLSYQGVLKALQLIDNYIEVTTMDGLQCHRALFSNMPDFEDMLQYESAQAAGCDVIVTRNEKHFPAQQIPVMSPMDFLHYYYADLSGH